MRVEINLAVVVVVDRRKRMEVARFVTGMIDVALLLVSLLHHRWRWIEGVRHVRYVVWDGEECGG